jgi:hypothetical protein
MSSNPLNPNYLRDIQLSTLSPQLLCHLANTTSYSPSSVPSPLHFSIKKIFHFLSISTSMTCPLNNPHSPPHIPKRLLVENHIQANHPAYQFPKPILNHRTQVLYEICISRK